MPPPPPIPQKESDRTPVTIKVLLVLLTLCGVTLGICLACGTGRTFSIQSGSMAPALERGDYVLVTRLGGKYRRGDIVVFNAPGMRDPKKNEVFVKRIVGLPGETLRIIDGALNINGVRTPLYNRTGEINYIFIPTAMFPMRADNVYTVSNGSYFLLGDNSPHSYDSRHFGYVSADAILGRVIACYAPWNRAGAVQ